MYPLLSLAHALAAAGLQGQTHAPRPPLAFQPLTLSSAKVQPSLTPRPARSQRSGRPNN
jgi:hypothetical protein